MRGAQLLACAHCPRLVRLRTPPARPISASAAAQPLPGGMNPAALITGTASATGIGRGILKGFLQAGYTCAGLDVVPHSQVDGDPLLQEHRHRFTLLHCDVSEPDQVEAAVAEAATFCGGQLMCLINNAGLADPNLEGNAEARRAKWQRFLAVNLSGPYYLTEACLARMPPGSAIVHISSVRALLSEAGTEGYTAAKAGLCGLTRAQAVTLGTPEKRIRVNSILPGWVDNTGGQLAVSEEDRDWHLVGRLGEPADIAEAALFLADPKRSGFITGQALTVDGGVSVKLVYPE